MLLVVSLIVLGMTPVETQPEANVNKQVVAQIQPIKAEILPQPVSEVKLVSVQKPFSTHVDDGKPLLSGSHEDWMQAAGISPNDYSYVEFIISHESGFRPDAINASSGACGLVQALPCSKLGNDWSNPINALSWGSEYANARYGGWRQAYEFWSAHRWW